LVLDLPKNLCLPLSSPFHIGDFLQVYPANPVREPLVNGIVKYSRSSYIPSWPRSDLSILHLKSLLAVLRDLNYQWVKNAWGHRRVLCYSARLHNQSELWLTTNIKENFKIWWPFSAIHLAVAGTLTCNLMWKELFPMKSAL